MNRCVTCGKAWGGVVVSHCSGCHETFSGPNWFDRHRDHRGGSERGKCRRPAEILSNKGARTMWLHEGVWRGTEDYHQNTPPVRA